MRGITCHAHSQLNCIIFYESCMVQYYTRVLYIPSLKAKRCLQVLNVLWVNLGILHSLQKNSPSGRLATLPSSPLGQASLHCCLHILGVVKEACFYCGCIKPYPLQNGSPFAGSCSAHMPSEEHEIVWTICRRTRNYTLSYHKWCMQGQSTDHPSYVSRWCHSQLFHHIYVHVIHFARVLVRAHHILSCLWHTWLSMASLYSVAL